MWAKSLPEYSPNIGLQPTPTAYARASLRLLARLRPSVRLHCLLQMMHAVFGKSSRLDQLANTLFSVITKTLENPQAFVSKFHIGSAL